MDPVSQFAVGGVFGAAFAPSIAARFSAAVRRLPTQPGVPAVPIPMGAAILCAGLAAMAPDLDILLSDPEQPLLAIKYHRHFTHALIMAPLYAALLAPIGWALFRTAGLSLMMVFWLAMLGIATHGPVDAMTNYGTHLFWPFTNARESWSIISIIDPIFTITLLLALLLAWRRQSRRPLLAAVVFCVMYWGIGLHQRTAAENAMHRLAASRGHTVERYEVKPAFANIVLWRAQYAHNGVIYTDAINVLPGLLPKIYPGQQQNLVVTDATWLGQFSPVLQQDIRDFAFFSDGWLAPVPGGKNQTGDARFAMLPNAPGPLWAIDPDVTTGKGHVSFVRLPRGGVPTELLWGMITRREGITD